MCRPVRLRLRRIGIVEVAGEVEGEVEVGRLIVGRRRLDNEKELCLGGTTPSFDLDCDLDCNLGCDLDLDFDLGGNGDDCNLDDCNRDDFRKDSRRDGDGGAQS